MYALSLRQICLVYIGFLHVACLYLKVDNKKIDYISYLKNYEKDLRRAEEGDRALAFRQNLYRIKNFNVANGSLFHLGVNEFADYLPSELKLLSSSVFEYRNMPTKPVNHRDLYTATYPESYNWDKSNNALGYPVYYSNMNHSKCSSIVAYSPIKNQGMCGGCYALVAASALEATVKIHTNVLVSLSAQELIDCDSNNYQCNGGSLTNAYNYIINHGLALASDYPYLGVVRCTP